MEKELGKLKKAPIDRQDIKGEPMPDLNTPLASLKWYQTQFLQNVSDLQDFLSRCKRDGFKVLGSGRRRRMKKALGRRSRLKKEPVRSEGSVSCMSSVTEVSRSGQGSSTMKQLPESSFLCTEASGSRQGGSTMKQLPDASFLCLSSLTEASDSCKSGSTTKQSGTTTKQLLDASISRVVAGSKKQLRDASQLWSLSLTEASIDSTTKQLSDTLMEASCSGEGASATKQLPDKSPLCSSKDDSARKQQPDASLLWSLSLTEASGSGKGASATKRPPGASLLWSPLQLTKASSNGVGGNATQQLPDASLVCRLKDVVCMLSSYSISIKHTNRVRISQWIREVLKLISNCRLAKVGSYYTSSESIEPATISPHVLEEIEFYIPYWFPSPSEEPEEVLARDLIGATTESVDLAVESAIAQLKICFVGEIQENIQMIAITGEGAKKVTSSLKDSGCVGNMFDYVLSITVSDDGNVLDVHEEIRQHLLGIGDMFKPAKKDVIILIDDVHDRLNLLECRPPRLFAYAQDVYLHFKMVVTRLQSVDEPLAVDLEIRMGDHMVPWSVFSRNVGQILQTSTTIQSIAVSIIKRCQGHLLAITVLARALREIADTDVWEDALYHMHSPVAGYNTNTHTVMINALKFCLSLKTRVARLYVKHYVHYAGKSTVLPSGLTPEEEERAMKDLVGSFLLQRSEDGEGLIMEEEIRQILLNSSVLDVCEMLEDGESNATEIELVNMGISQLPQSPSCPMLTGLFLQMNSDLTGIHSSFFRHMPCLKALNLSNTSISSLPESLFQLSSLEKLYLKDCELFMVLPPQIKEVKNLKELDLQGTALINLPKEIGDLKKLTCLKLSFIEDLDFSREYPSETMIPTGVLSKLSMLMALSIDVNPADKRWEEAVKVVIRELPYLKQLKSLEMYLPEVTLLGELTTILPSLIDDSTIQFILTVGRHQRQIMSRVPHGVEGRFRNLRKCFKYVNGNEDDSNISAQVMDVLKYSDSFFLNRHFTVTDLTKLGIRNLDKLRFCVLGENDKLGTIMEAKDPYEGIEERTCVLQSLEDLIIYRMKNMRSICEGKLPNGSMGRLKSLTLDGCPRLEVVFTPWLLSALCCLEELRVEDCPAISSLVRENVDELKVRNMEGRSFLIRLKNVCLHHLPELKSVFGGLNTAPAVERMSIYDCPNLQSLPGYEFFSPRSKVFRGERHWLSYLACRKYDNSNGFHASRVFVPFGRHSHFKTQLAADGFNF